MGCQSSKTVAKKDAGKRKSDIQNRKQDLHDQEMLEDFIEMDFGKSKRKTKASEEKKIQEIETKKQEEYQREVECASHKTESCIALPNYSPKSAGSPCSTRRQIPEVAKSEESLNKRSEEELSKSASCLPLPSAGITTTAERNERFSNSRIMDASKDKDLKALLRLICGATNNSSFSNCTALNLSLHRAACLTPDFQDALINLVSKIDFLSHLDLSGNHAGPVAVRALFQTLIGCDVVEELDVSDNLADSNCTGLLSQLLQSCKHLYSLNLSGNNLGKESLSRCLSESMANNDHLVKLNISSCGAANLHGLFEGLSIALNDGKFTLEYLDMSNNETNNGFLLGQDIAMLLQHSSCKLNYLNFENTGVSSAGWDAIIQGMKSNKLLRELHGGGSSNQVLNVLKIPEILFSSRYLSTLDLKDLSAKEQIQQDSIIVIVDGPEPELSIMKLNLAHCNLSDHLLLSMAQSYPGKLPSLTWLNLSHNPDVSINGITAFKDLTLSEGSCFVQTLLLSGLKFQGLEKVFSDSFAGITTLSLIKSRISLTELCDLKDLTKDLSELTLDGIKIGQNNVLTSLGARSAKYRLSKLGLRGCGLADSDLVPFIEALSTKVPAFANLLSLDISVNRLSNAVKELAQEMQATSHSLENMNVANNAVNDEGAQALADHLLSPQRTSKLKVLDISHNQLSKKGLLALMNTVCSKASSTGLVSLDVSSQKHGLNDDELDDVVEALVAAIGLDPERAMHECAERIPQLPTNFNVNLSNLGGSTGPLARLMDSVAIKTDFAKVCDTSPSLNDYLLICNGLKCSAAPSSSTSVESPMFSSNEWTAIIGSDAPAWLKIDDERKKGVYVSHLPGSATLQRLEGILESEADCSVSETIFIKDPALLKQSGAAWVLFADEQSVKQAIEWYARGEAQIFGTAFCISPIPVSVASYDSSVTSVSEKEKASRSDERKQKEESDRIMLEESQQVAAERAEYREAHPAYQNGRIW